MQWAPNSDRLYNPRFVASAILACVVLAGGLITLLVKTAPSDSAEQLLWAQDWRLGYGIQPPLYTWIQLAFFKVFGMNLGSLAFLKEILMGFIGWFTYLAALRMTNRPKLAALACVAMLLMPEFSYETHRNLSHTLLTTALAAATLFLFVKLALASKPNPALYLWLGVATGAGLLSKYNFGIFTVACCASALCVPNLRRVVLNRWMLVALIVAAVIFAPHIWWLMDHLHSGLSDQMAVKMHPEAEHAWLSSVATGLAAVFKMTIGMFFLPSLLVFPAAMFIGRKEKNPACPGTDIWRRFLFFLFFWEATAVAVLIFGFRVTNFQSRWFVPWLFFLPLYLLLQWHERLSRAARRFIFVLSLTGGIVAVLVYACGAQIAKLTHHYHGADIPFEELAEKIRADGFDHGQMISDEHLVIGNLRLHLPNTSLTSPHYSGPQPIANSPMLIIWGPNVIRTPEFDRFVKQNWPDALRNHPVRSVDLNFRDSSAFAGKFSYVIIPSEP